MLKGMRANILPSKKQIKFMSTFLYKIPSKAVELTTDSLAVIEQSYRVPNRVGQTSGIILECGWKGFLTILLKDFSHINITVVDGLHSHSMRLT